MDCSQDSIALFFLSTELHDRLNAPILRTDHLEHALVLRRSFEECGKIFVIGVLYRGCVAAVPVIDQDRRTGAYRIVHTFWIGSPSSTSGARGSGARCRWCGE